MTATIIIILCALLLLAYIFDLTSSRTRIPSVILLLFLGWSVRQLSKFVDIAIPDLTAFLPVLGTIGLILIVLDGALELEFNKTKLPIIKSSFVVALVPMVVLSFLLAWLFSYNTTHNLKDSLLNAIPFAVISSAIAIPSVYNLSKKNKEFIIYESSFSDILGILFFNFLAANASITIISFFYFGMNLLIIAGISFIATIGLALLLSKIDHKIKFVPIIILIILIYEVAKVYHLPSLLFILLFGLFLGNLDELNRFRVLKKLKPGELDKEVHKFKELLTEGTFLVRAIFFLLFGYLMKTSEVMNGDTIFWALLIVAAIIIIRLIILRLYKLPLEPLLYIAPRGLITILLFITILPEKSMPFVNKSLIIQVIVLTAFVMMLGLLFSGKKSDDTELKVPPAGDEPEPELLNENSGH